MRAARALAWRQVLVVVLLHGGNPIRLAQPRAEIDLLAAPSLKLCGRSIPSLSFFQNGPPLHHWTAFNCVVRSFGINAGCGLCFSQPSLPARLIKWVHVSCFADTE